MPGLIAYPDKEQFQVNPLPDENQWKATDANHVKAIVNGNFLAAFKVHTDAYDASNDEFPQPGAGFGTGGAIMQFEVWVTANAGSFPSEDGLQEWPPGTLVIALVAAPANDYTKWRLI